MNESRLTIVGIVTTAPELSHTNRSDQPVTNFQIACQSRTFNRAHNRWQQTGSLQLKVVCWERLAENVAASVRRGDPVMIAGNLGARSYRTEDGRRHLSYEVKATAIGPDLNAGTTVFARSRPDLQSLDDRASDASEESAAAPALLGAAMLEAIAGAGVPDLSSPAARADDGADPGEIGGAAPPEPIDLTDVA